MSVTYKLGYTNDSPCILYIFNVTYYGDFCLIYYIIYISQDTAALKFCHRQQIVHYMQLGIFTVQFHWPPRHNHIKAVSRATSAVSDFDASSDAVTAARAVWYDQRRAYRQLRHQKCRDFWMETVESREALAIRGSATWPWSHFYGSVH